MLFFFPPLACALYGLLLPYQSVPIYLWISVFLILVYTCYSFISINYLTLSAEITCDYNKQTTLVSFREAFALIGISIGSIVPSFLLNRMDIIDAHFYTWLLFVALGMTALTFFLFFSPKPIYQKASYEKILPAVQLMIREKNFKRLIYINLLSSVAASLPATIVLFYIQDVIQSVENYGLFLTLYFIPGLVGLPIWYSLSKKYSKRVAWMTGMVLTIISFIYAGFLGPGDVYQYGVICVLSGICLGADLSMPVSILSDLISKQSNKGKYYGVWGMISKVSIAVAGSLGLLILGLLGYHPDEAVTESSRYYVAMTYAIVPCIFKLLSLLMLIKWDVEISEKD